MNYATVDSLAEESGSNRAGEKARVLLVDDHPVTRKGLAALINQNESLMVCGEADSMQRALDLLDRTQPALVVSDISLKTSNGLELVKNIKARIPAMPILVISMYDENLYAERALRAGAMGYVMKNQAPELLLRAIQRVLAGEIHLGEGVRDRMLLRLVSGAPQEAGGFAIDSLSDREMEVFQLIGNGFGTRQIAAQLGLSVKTIDSYREHLKSKLALSNTSELVRHAIQWARNECLV